MTTEDDFQAALDADPGDWQTRLVFADWLQERDDPRAEGYRALGVLKKHSFFSANDDNEGGWHLGTQSHPFSKYAKQSPWGVCALPGDWHRVIPKTQTHRKWPSDGLWCYFDTRREADDAAALAFARLFPARRAQLLNPLTVTA